MFSSQSWDGRGSKGGVGGHDKEVETERTQRRSHDKEREVPRENERDKGSRSVLCRLCEDLPSLFHSVVPDLERTRVLGGRGW